MSVSARPVPAVQRGAYTAERGSALAGVPRSTLYLWAREGPLPSSISSERVKLWSWTDLVALRAVYWLRHPVPAGSRRPTPMPLVRRLIEEVERQAGRIGEAITLDALILSVDADGVPYVEIDGRLTGGRGGFAQTVLREFVIDLLAPFAAESSLAGPDLLRPRDGLRIIPGKLSGEPHVEHTRIETRVLWALNRRGYTAEQLLSFYSDLTPSVLRNAFDLEQQLEANRLTA